MNTPQKLAVLPIRGYLTQRGRSDNLKTSTMAFTQLLRQVMADPSVSAIVIDIDSYGSDNMYGVSELADVIFATRGMKPVHAIANSMAAGAAYWSGSAADDFSATPGGEVGAVGVSGIHVDESRALGSAGLKITLLSGGKYKTEGNRYEPLGAEAKAAMQRRVDEYYAMFVKGVARNRGVSQTAVRDGYGQGRVLGAAAALKAGMIDRVETLDQMLARIGARGAAAAGLSFESRLRRLRLSASCGAPQRGKDNDDPNLKVQ